MKSKQNNRAPAPAAVARPHMSVAKKLMAISLCTLATVMAVLSAAIGYAYFTKEEVYDAYFGIDVSGKWFDELNDEALAAYQTGVLGMQTADPGAAWGSEQNPYVISESKHLYNLSQLQNVGYFERLYISQNTFNDGVLDTEKPIHMPYFLVCDKEGKPVCIKGGNEPLDAIGTEKYPFIGSVKGAFYTSDTDENGNTTAYTCEIPAAGDNQTPLTAGASTIHNWKVIGTDNSVDSGLFAHIKCLGDPSTATTDTTTGEASFVGVVSEVSNLLLSDVTITVDTSKWKTVWTAVLEHIFSYTALSQVDGYESTYKYQIPHETNHIGILAGHVTYSKVEMISVYYSSDTHVAIDLSHTLTRDDGVTANYMSGTGIIGFMDGMNPKVNDDGTLSKDTGLGNGSVSSGSSDMGGGGLLSGKQAGYVLARYIYDEYHYLDNPDYNANVEGSSPVTEVQNDGAIPIATAKDKDGNPLCTEWEDEGILGINPNSGTVYSYFYDGVFTFSVSTAKGEAEQDVMEPTWPEGVDENQFYVGPDQDSAWEQDNTEGAHVVVAYMREVDVTQITPGKPYYIFAKKSDDEVFLMTLYYGSEDRLSGGNTGDDRYYTGGMSKSYVSLDILQAAWDSDQYSMPAGTTREQFENGEVIALNLGTAADMSTLANQYQITIDKTSDTTTTYTLGTQGVVSKTNSTSQYNRLFFTYRYYFLGEGRNMYCGTESGVRGLLGHQAHTAEFTFSPDGLTSNGFTLGASVTNDGTLESRFMYYGDDAFHAGENATQSTTLYIYEPVGREEMNFGRVTYKPTDTTTYPAKTPDQYVLFANSDNSDANDTYELTRLNELDAAKWQNGKGTPLSEDPDSLTQKFRMIQGINFGVRFNLNIFGINLGSLGSNGLITAQVGSLGTEAIIPKGCVAFKIEKTEGPKKVRVIVAMPTSEKYLNEEGEDNTLLSMDRYFNMWKMPESGDSMIQVFQADDYIDRFKIPRSMPYNPISTAANSEYIQVTDSVNPNTGLAAGTTYRCYPNGDRILIAYEFTVPDGETGIYVLGTSGYQSTDGSYESAPMEIVYFSADGVASEGRDGVNNSQLGTIDFVYNNASSILTVTASSSLYPTGETDANDNDIMAEDPTRAYYPSYAILFFDSELNIPPTTEGAHATYIDINKARVMLKRRVLTTTTGEGETAKNEYETNIIYSTVLDDTTKSRYGPYVKVNPYSITVSDSVTDKDATTP